MKLRPPIPFGFSLIEITLALGVVAVSLLTIFGLFATGLEIDKASLEQTASVQILTAVAADLRATPSATNTSLQFGIQIPTNTTLFFDAGGQYSRVPNNDSRYRLAITFVIHSGGRAATRVNLRVTWPAGADPTHSNTQASEMFVALDRN